MKLTGLVEEKSFDVTAEVEGDTTYVLRNVPGIVPDVAALAVKERLAPLGEVTITKVEEV